MKMRILSYIDNHLTHESGQPIEQLVYIIAKLSLLSSPTAWLVKSVERKNNAPFLSLSDALIFMKKNTNSTDYIIPLYTAVRVQVCGNKIIPPNQNSSLSPDGDS